MSLSPVAHSPHKLSSSNQGISVVVTAAKTMAVLAHQQIAGPTAAL